MPTSTLRSRWRNWRSAQNWGGLDLDPARVFERMRASVSGFLFAPTDARGLSLFRCLYCLWIAIALSFDGSYLRAHRSLLYHPETFAPIRLFHFLSIGAMSASTFAMLRTTLVAVLICAAIGVFARWTLILSWTGFFLYYGTINSAAKPAVGDSIGHITDPVVFVLWMLSISPAIDRWGVGSWISRGRWSLRDHESATMPAWPLQSLKLFLAIIYFGSGYCKLGDGLFWADGYTLQAYLLQGALENNAGLNVWLAQHLWLCSLISCVTLLFEAGFWTVLLFPSLTWLYVITGLGMHATIYITMNRNYFTYFVPLYWVFLSGPIASWARRLPGMRQERTFASSADAGRLTRKHRYSAIGCVVVFAASQLFCVFKGVDAWPFSSWRFFCLRTSYAHVSAFRIEEVLQTGERRWIRRNRRENVLVSEMFQRLSWEHDADGMKRQLQNMIGSLSKENRGTLKSLRLVRRTATTNRTGGFDFVDEPILELSAK